MQKYHLQIKFIRKSTKMVYVIRLEKQAAGMVKIQQKKQFGLQIYQITASFLQQNFSNISYFKSARSFYNARCLFSLT